MTNEIMIDIAGDKVALNGLKANIEAYKKQSKAESIAFNFATVQGLIEKIEELNIDAVRYRANQERAWKGIPELTVSDISGKDLSSKDLFFSRVDAFSDEMGKYLPTQQGALYGTSTDRS